MPTRFRNASTVGSPQYPAAIAAGIRRGQEPAGIMEERVIANGLSVSCPLAGCRSRRSLATFEIWTEARSHKRVVRRTKGMSIG
jgi:hypothetical protein